LPRNRTLFAVRTVSFAPLIAHQRLKGTAVARLAGGKCPAAKLVAVSFAPERIESKQSLKEYHTMWRSLGLVLALGVALAMQNVAEGAVTHQGKVTAVGNSNISIIDNVGDSETFDVAADVKVTHNGKRADLSAIDAGDVAKLTLKKVDGKFVVVIIDARDME
jgi:hypothetical protein